MRASAPEADGVYTVVDRRRPAVKAMTALVWFGASYMLYRVKLQPPADQPFAVPGTIVFFAVCSFLLVYELMLHPIRVTTIRPLQREVVIRETARWRKRERVMPIGPGIYFEMHRWDSEASSSYGVRFRSPNKKWLTIAEHLSKDEAERIAREANARLGRY